MNNHLPDQSYVPTSTGLRIIPLLTLSKIGLGHKDLFGIKFKKILRRAFFKM